MKLMMVKDGLLDHQQKAVLGDACDLQGTGGAGVQKAMVEDAGRKESLTHMQSGQWEMKTALEQMLLQDRMTVEKEQQVVEREQLPGN